MRLAANTPSGFPVLLSLWFRRDGDEILAAIHQGSRIARRLQADGRVAFEIAPNEPPYCGVRGQAIAALERELRMALGTKTEIRPSSRGRGKIVIHYTSHDEFERLRTLISDNGGIDIQSHAG